MGGGTRRASSVTYSPSCLWSALTCTAVRSATWRSGTRSGAQTSLPMFCNRLTTFRRKHRSSRSPAVDRYQLKWTFSSTRTVNRKRRPHFMPRTLMELIYPPSNNKSAISRKWTNCAVLLSHSHVQLTAMLPQCNTLPYSRSFM